MAGKFKNLLVVSDIDGTLLQAGYGIPKENIDAIDSFIANGGLFTVATGRSIEAVRKYTDWLNFSAPAILCNGGLIYDYSTGKTLYERSLDEEATTHIIEDVLKEFPEVGIEIHRAGKIVVCNMNAEVDAHVTRQHMAFTLCEAPTLAKEHWNKLLFVDAEARLAPVKKYILDRVENGDPLYCSCDFIGSSAKLFELIPKGVNKGDGLMMLAELLGIDKKNTVAIGDFDNDLDMLNAAGYSAAVADGSPAVRAAADVTVCSCLQGGVAELLNSLDNLNDGYIQLKLEL